MAITLMPWVELMFKILITLLVIQYGSYVISRVYIYYVDMKRANLSNPKYSLDDLDRVYKAKKKREEERRKVVKL